MGSTLRFLPFLLAVALVASVGGLFGPGDWYSILDKPWWVPPPWVFAPFWSLLYLMTALAAWMVWESAHEQRNRAIGWWTVHLLLNAAWTFLFFGMHRLGWAFGGLVLLLIAIAVTYDRFRQIRPAAAYLLLPYMAWVSFALLINLVVWQRNGGGLAFTLGVSG